MGELVLYKNLWHLKELKQPIFISNQAQWCFLLARACRGLTHKCLGYKNGLVTPLDWKKSSHECERKGDFEIAHLRGLFTFEYVIAFKDSLRFMRWLDEKTSNEYSPKEESSRP